MNSNLFWCIVGIIGGAIVSAFFYFINIKRKKLLCIFNTTPIVSNSNTHLKGVTVSYNNKPVHELYITKITIKNTGNSTIEPSDFAPIEPLHLITSGIFFTEEKTSTENIINKNFNNTHVTYEYNKTNEICIKSIINFDYIAKRETISITLFHSGELYLHGKLKDGKIIKSEIENIKDKLIRFLFYVIIIILSNIFAFLILELFHQ